MEILDVKVVQGFLRMCNDGWEQGWHERNGGNLTYRMRAEEVETCRPYFVKTPSEWVAMNVKAEDLGGSFFMTTGSGRFFRNAFLAPVETAGIVEISKTGDAWRIVWGLENGGQPTSEFSAHFLNHSVRSAATNGEARVMYHAHPANVVAMTYLLPLTARDFTRALWQSETECPVVFPGGVGVVGCMVPGSIELAEATAKCMQEYDAVVWANHGLICAGPDFDAVFGLMHTIEKAADIYIRVLSAGQGRIRQTITDDELRAIAKAFRVTIKEEFLD